jgi:hypothetical protein
LTPGSEDSGAASGHEIRRTFAGPVACLVCDRRTHAVLAEIDLNAYVPAALRHDPVDRHTGDTYHFNSLTFFADRLLVLAHNWSFGGFALEFRLDGPAARAGRLELTNAYRGLGFESHDVFMDRSGVYALDSGQNRLVHADHPSLSLGPLRFPRGLAATPAQFVVGTGERAVDRETRQATRTTLLIVDRAAWQVAAEHDLGAYGNTCDVLLLDQPDLTDAKGASFRWRPLRRLAARLKHPLSR